MCTSTLHDDGIDYQAHNLQTDLLLHIMFFHCLWIIWDSYLQMWLCNVSALGSIENIKSSHPSFVGILCQRPIFDLMAPNVLHKLTYLLTYILASLSGPNSARARTQLTLSLMKQFRSNRLTLHQESSKDALLLTAQQFSQRCDGN